MLGVTVTLTASFFDCPLPSSSLPCTDALLGESPMTCTWIRSTAGGEVRLVGAPLQPPISPGSATLQQLNNKKQSE